jgi:hypothetical protein
VILAVLRDLDDGLLMGYDTTSDEVRSVVLMTPFASGGVAVAADVGAQLGTNPASRHFDACLAGH